MSARSKRRGFGGSDFGEDAYVAVSAEDADPRVGLVNLADVMLVFACGLMVALVVANGLQLSSSNVDTVEMTEIDSSELNNLADKISDGSGTAYRERGVVYEDPDTGQLYMLEEVTDEDEDSTEAADVDGE